MNEIKILFTKIFKPQQTLKSITRLTSHRTHHGLGYLQNFFPTNKPRVVIKMNMPTQMLLEHSEH